MLNGMIRTGRLEAFVDELVKIHNEEYKEKATWEVWLHRVFDQSYSEFAQSVDQGSSTKPSKDELANIVSESQNMLEAFTPE